jgi:hypothetical protein
LGAIWQSLWKRWQPSLDTDSDIRFQGILPNQSLKSLRIFTILPKKAAANFHHCLPIHLFFPQKIANSIKQDGSAKLISLPNALICTGLYLIGNDRKFA